MMKEPLEPPGTIAVIGAGPAGLEAALYGRYLGYDVTVLEAADVGQTWRDSNAADQPLPFLADRGLSNLAMTAVKTQHEASGATPRALPTTVGQWINEVLEALADSDLLSGRIRTHCRVTGIELAAVDAESDHASADGAASDDDSIQDESVEETPVHDFLLWLEDPNGSHETLQVEAVIDTTGGGSFDISGFPTAPPLPASDENADFRTATAYFYRLQNGQAESAEVALAGTRDQIRRLYAMLGDRAGLDLYRPFRM